MGWAIALHGGAGSIPLDMSPDLKDNVQSALNDCLHIGISALQASRSALDVAEIVVRALENNPLFNAGRGSVLTTRETVEMEACIMDGVTRNCGAVSGLSTVVNPISLARLVMEKTRHIYLAFDGAEEFARQQGVEVADPKYFITDKRVQQVRAAQSNQLDSKPDANSALCSMESVTAPEENTNTSFSDNNIVGETVGCVVVDKLGHCAAATSTGGFSNKMVGRIGDTPIVGAGNYANHLCAVSATGIGEYIIRATVAREVAAIMEYKGASLTEAVNEVIERRLEKGTGGLIAVSSKGEIAMALNTTGMYRAAADESGYSTIKIWH